MKWIKLSYQYPYKCNECGHRWKDVKFQEGLVRCARCSSKNIEDLNYKKFLGLERTVWFLLFECSIVSIIFGSSSIFLYYVYLYNIDFVLWWIIPLGFYGGFFAPIFWFSHYDRQVFLGLKNKVWIVLIISVISSIVVGSVLSVLYYEILYIIDGGLWWVIPVGFVVGFLLPTISYLESRINWERLGFWRPFQLVHVGV